MANTDMTPIPNAHFIGAGAHPWLIAGRVPGDGTDSVRLVLADSEQQAREVFRENILKQADLNEQDIIDTAELYGSDMIYSMTLKLA